MSHLPGCEPSAPRPGPEHPLLAPERLADVVRRSSDFIAICRESNVSSLRRRHGEAFLLHNGPLGVLRKPSASQTTKTFGAVSGDQPFRPEREFLVFPVRKNRKTFSGFISLGRDSSNDVVIPDVSLTAYHAFFKPEEGGRFFLLDAASKNGTFVDEEPVPQWGAGDPVEVTSGTSIRFGSIKLVFLGVAEFHKLALGLDSG